MQVVPAYSSKTHKPVASKASIVVAKQNTRPAKIPVVRDAKRELSFTINQEHVRIAKMKDPCYCVIAQALRNSAIGEVFDSIEVGPTMTKVYSGNKIIRYSTPVKLATALKQFDETGLWPLPVGTYHLNPPTGVKSLEGVRTYTASKTNKTSSKTTKGIKTSSTSKFQLRSGAKEMFRAPAATTRTITRTPKHRTSEVN